MLLRNKLSVISLLFFLVAAAGLTVTLKHLSDIREGELGAHISTHQVGLWLKIVDEKLTQLILSSTQPLEDQPLHQALATANAELTRERGRDLFSDIRSQYPVSRMEIYSLDGDMIFTSQTTYFPTPVLIAADVTRAIAPDGDRTKGGLAIDVTDGALVVVISVIETADVPVGVVVVAMPVTSILEEFAELTDGDVFLINRRGRLLSGTNQTFWSALSARGEDEDGTGAFRNITVGELVFDDKTYWVTVSEVDGIRNPIGRVATVKDVSVAQEKFQRLERTTYIATVIFIVLATAILWMYMRHSFNPLNDAIGTLRGLAQGHFPPRIRVGDTSDEVSSIGIAINKFRSELMRLASMTRSRHNRSRRQARLIRRELTNVAMNLDEKAREDTMQDLRDIEERMESAAEANQDVQSGRELAAIALTLTRLRERIHSQHGDLVKTIAELEEALVAKNAYVALQHELSIGTKVQHAMLPADLPTTDRLEISGLMKTAKEVGGDFYDFFYLDEDRLGVVVADVSGKGVPAALFMAISRSILRATAPIYASPGACLAAVNDTLCGDNKEDYFVTVFYGILDLKTGLLTYANGGHNPPLVRVDSDQSVVTLPLTGGMALGVFDGVDYTEQAHQLSKDDVLYLYTDGITEAINHAEEEYQMDRLQAQVVKIPVTDASSFLKLIVADVDEFAGDMPQADDITCVAIRFKQP